MLIYKTKEKEFDVRVRDKLVSTGLLAPNQIEAYLKGLADEQGNVLEINPQELDDDIISSSTPSE